MKSKRLKVYLFLSIGALVTLSVIPVTTATTQVSNPVINKEVKSDNPVELTLIDKKKDSVFKILNKIEKQVRQPRVIYKTKWKTEYVTKYVPVPSDTVYILVTDTLSIPEGSQYIIEQTEQHKTKSNWFKNLFKKKKKTQTTPNDY